MKLHPCHIWLRTQVRIAHYIQVGEARKPQRLAQPATARRLKVRDEIGVVALAPRRSLAAYAAAKLIAQVQRAQQGSLILAAIAKTICSLVRRVKTRMRLENDVDLPRHKPRRSLRVWKHGQRAIVFA